MPPTKPLPHLPKLTYALHLTLLERKESSHVNCAHKISKICFCWLYEMRHQRCILAIPPAVSPINLELISAPNFLSHTILLNWLLGYLAFVYRNFSMSPSYLLISSSINRNMSFGDRNLLNLSFDRFFFLNRCYLWLRLYRGWETWSGPSVTSFVFKNAIIVYSWAWLLDVGDNYISSISHCKHCYFRSKISSIITLMLTCMHTYI